MLEVPYGCLFNHEECCTMSSPIYIAHRTSAESQILPSDRAKLHDRYLTGPHTERWQDAPHLQYKGLM